MLLSCYHSLHDVIILWRPVVSHFQYQSLAIKAMSIKSHQRQMSCDNFSLIHQDNVTSWWCCLFSIFFVGKMFWMNIFVCVLKWCFVIKKESWETFWYKSRFSASVQHGEEQTVKGNEMDNINDSVLTVNRPNSL